MRRFTVLFTLLLLVAGLYGQSGELAKSLSAAGENRSELEKVLAHYAQNKSDSLKWKAACFLIENMPAHYAYVGAEVDHFYSVMRTVFENPRNLGRAYYTEKYDSLLNVLGFGLSRSQIRPDVKSITSEYLIRNIDKAFQMWDTPWAKHLSFDLFCEYILPYRAGTEPLSDWRQLFIDRKPTELDLLRAPANKTFMYGMCNSLNQQFVANLYFPSTFMPEFPLADLYILKSGSCRDYSNQGLAQMRAMGIPVAIDFVPQWGGRSMGHEWNAVIPQEGIAVPFATNSAVGNHLYGLFEEKATKVFRKTYQRQKESLFYLSQDEAIPILFDNPCLKDVTAQYIGTRDIEAALFTQHAGMKFAYLAAFDNQQWQIVQWGKVEGHGALFREMGMESVYLPVRYLESGNTIPAGWPVLCRESGSEVLIPDLQKKQSVRLTRKFRTSRNLENCVKMVWGGKFQVAHKPDFSDSVTIYTISELPDCSFQRVDLKYKGKYTYFRYLAPRDSKCNMAEIELYDEKGLRLPADSIFSIDGGDKGREDRMCFDGNVFTYYNAQWNPHNGWVGLKFNTPVHLSHLYYLPRNDDNFIREGEIYELYYWDQSGWQSLGKKTGVKEAFLVYEEVPSNALFLLRNHTKGKEERIFTYEDGRQVWW